MDNVFVKVLVSDRLPSDLYSNECMFMTSNGILSKSYVTAEICKWWLEEIQLPTEEEIKETCTGWKEETKSECYEAGANFIIDHIKKGGDQ